MTDDNKQYIKQLSFYLSSRMPRKLYASGEKWFYFFARAAIVNIP